MEELIVKVKGKEYKVKVEETNDGRIKVYCGSDVYELDGKSEIEPLFADMVKEPQSAGEDENLIKAPLPGIVFSVLVKIGDNVKKGDVLVKIMAMKMENEVTAPKDCVIKEIRVKKDNTVNRGDILIVLELTKNS